MSKSFYIIFIFFITLGANGQQSEWKAPEPGSMVVGFGPTFIGLNAKAGVFLNHNFLLGIDGELHHFLSSRKESGIFLRKYLNHNTVQFFAQSGVAYGTFQAWGSMDIDNWTPSPPKYESFKLNFSSGAEIQITRSLSLEGGLGVGKLFKTNWWAPSIKASVNYRFGKKADR